MAAQQIDFRMKGFHVLKAAINGSEADVTHLVEVPQLLHDEFADGSRGHLAFAEAPQLMANPRDRRFDRLAAARVLGVDPELAVVFEDALSGVEAGRAGGFGFVVGVDRVGQAEALRAHGADVVVTDLAELLGRT